MTYERFGNQSFGLTPPDPDAYFLQRYLLHTDLRAGSRVRVWTEFNSGLENGRFGEPRPVIDEDKFDLHQAFVDVAVAATSPSAAVLRVGRQEIALDACTPCVRDRTSLSASTASASAIAHAGIWRLDGWAARPVDNTAGVFDDGSHHSFDVWGVYRSRVITLSPHSVGLDVYYLGLARDTAHFDQGTANETRHTFGARAWHQGAWAYDAEAMFQVGRFGSGDIRAWRSVIEGSHLAADAVWLPRLGLVLDVASGDKNPADPNLQTLNALFQSGTYSGRAQLLGPSNSIRFEPSVTFGPARHMLVSAGWGFYWLPTARSTRA